MDMEKVIKVFEPYLNGHSFLVQRKGYPDRECLNARMKKGKIVIHQDFFTPMFIIDDKWEAWQDKGKIILTSDMNEEVTLIPQNMDTKSLPIVDWVEKMAVMNFVNSSLWEEGLVREIAGNIYYPLDLFRFKDLTAVRKSSVMKTLVGSLGIKYINRLKTLYYYIDKKDSRLYIGVWDYKRYMPLDPTKCCIMET